MLSTLAFIVTVYFVLIVAINSLLAGKASISLLSWFKVYGLMLKLNGIVIKISSVHLIIRPWNLISNSKSDGVLTVDIGDLKIDLTDFTPSSDSNSKSRKTTSSTTSIDVTRLIGYIKRLQNVFPIRIQLENAVLINGAKSLNMNHFEVSLNFHTNNENNNLHVGSSILYDNFNAIEKDGLKSGDFSCRFEVTDEAHINDFRIEAGGRNHTIDIQLLKDFMNPIMLKVSEAKSHGKIQEKPEPRVQQLDKPAVSLTELYDRFEIKSLSLCLESLTIVNGKVKLSLETFKFSTDNLKTEIADPKPFENREIHELLLGFTSLKLTIDDQPSYVYLPSLNISSHTDLRHIISIYEKRGDEEYILGLSELDNFIWKTTISVNNLVLSSSLDDVFKYLQTHQKPSKKPAKAIRSNTTSNQTYIHLLKLLPRVKTRIQLLSSLVQFELSDDLALNLGIEDIIFDTSLTENLVSLFAPHDISLSTKVGLFFIRNAQLSAYESRDISYKVLALDFFDTSIYAKFNGDSYYIEKLRMNISTFEILLEHITMFQKLHKISKTLPSFPNEVKEEEIVYEETDVSGPITSDTLISSIIAKVEFQLDNLKFISCFTNPVKYYEGVDQSAMNSYQRGLSAELTDLFVSFDNSHDVQKLSASFDELRFDLITDYAKEKYTKELKNFVSIEQFQMKYFVKSNKLSVVLPLVDTTLSAEVMWSVMFIQTILTSIIPSSKSPKTKKVNKVAKKGPALTYLIGVRVFMLKLELPSNIDLVLELDTLEALPTVDDDIYIRFKAVRLYGRNPYVIKMWSLILILSDASILVKTGELIDNEPRANVNTRSIRFEIPFEYVFFRAFDNIKGLLKSHAKIAANFKNLMDIPETDENFSVPTILPTKVEHPFSCPKVKIHAKQFQFCMHDDPFENELNAIFLLGKAEQKSRSVKMVQFQQYVTKFKKQLEEKYTALTFVDGEAVKPDGYSSDNKAREKSRWEAKHSRVPSNSDNSNNSSQHQNGSSELNDKATSRFHSRATNPAKSFRGRVNGLSNSTPLPKSRLANEVHTPEYEQYSAYLDELHTGVEVPRARLLSNISKSWIIRVQACRKAAKTNYSKRAQEVKGGNDPPVSDIFLNKYPVISAYCIAPLFSLELLNMNWIFDKPAFGLANYAEFLHKIGRGMPKDMEYGILFPVNLEISCSALTVQIKDFPLPLIAFGGGAHDHNDAVILKGDVVVAEQMYTMDELRYNFVPLVSQYADKNQTESLYAAHVSRTMTDVKFYTDMKVTVTSHRNAIVSWFPSMQPALGYAMDSFDVLSKPPLDTSPKIGFWDKLSLLFLARFDFEFKNGIHLFIKGGTSPYNVVGKAAGFVFRWNDNVNLKINSNGNPVDFLIVESKGFEIAIPRFETVGVESMLFSGRPLHGISYSVHKKVLKLNSNPVIWKMGFAFERNLTNEKEFIPGEVARTSVFKPHWNVRLRNPSSFKDGEDIGKWDAFEGYRSNYIHMAISIVSEDTDPSFSQSYNSTHLSPLAFLYFNSWWDMFDSNLGLPIKDGKIFKNKFMDYSPSVSFGKNLFSISYHVNIQPLYLTHVYRYATDMHANSHIAYTGLKASVRRFSMDLHQTKTEVPIFDRKDDGPKTDWKLKFKQGEIDVVNTDLRILTAVFDDMSAAGMLARAIGIESSTSSYDSPVTSSSSDHMSRDETADIVWYDEDDFVELETPKLMSIPRWKVHTFASSPRFSYFKNEADDNLTHPFELMQARTHNCLLGKNHPELTTQKLADERSIELKEQISNHQATLDSLHSSVQDGFSTKRIKELEAEILELENRLHIVRCLKDEFAEGRVPSVDEFEDDNDISDVETTYSASKTVSHISHLSHMSHASRLSSPSMAHPVVNSNVSSFRNRFIIYNMLLRWSPHVRNKFVKYIDNVGERRSMVFNLSRKAIKLAEDLYNSTSTDSSKTCERLGDYEFESSDVMFEDFDKYLHDTDGLSNVDTEDTYLLKFIMPQLRLDNDSTSCVLVASKEIVVSSISVNSKCKEITSDDDTNSAEIESRNGVVLYDAYFYVLEKEKAQSGHYKFFHYDVSEVWPPKLPVEMYYDPQVLDNATVIRKLSCGLIYVKPNKLHYAKEDKFENTCFKEVIKLLSPQVIVTASSSQYQIIYNVIMTLLTKTNKTEQQKLKDEVAKLVKFSDMENFLEIAGSINSLQEQARLLSECRGIFLATQGTNNNENSEVSLINVELEKLYLQLNVMVAYLQQTKALKFNDSYEERQFFMAADYIRLELLDEKRQNFVTVEATKTFYLTDQRPDGASRNRVSVDTFIAEDNQANAQYTTIIERYEQGSTGKKYKPMAFVDWELMAPVSGIQIVDHKFIEIASVKIELDYKTAMAIYAFVYNDGKTSMDDTKTDDSELSLDDSDGDSVDDFDEISTIASDGSSYMSQRSLTTSSFDTTSSESTKVSPSDTEHNTRDKLSRRFSLLKRKTKDKTSELSTPKSRPMTVQRNQSTDSTLCFSCTKKSKQDEIDQKEAEKRYINQVVERSQLYQLLNKITFAPMTLCLSFHGQGKYKLIDVTRLVIQVPVIEFSNKVWSQEELFQNCKKQIIKVVLRHTTKIIGNKLTHHKKKNREPQILSHASNGKGKTSTKSMLQSNTELNSRKTLTIKQDDSHRHEHHGADHHIQFQDPDVLEPGVKVGHHTTCIESHPISAPNDSSAGGIIAFQTIEEIEDEK
ncbi:hypothetical protein CANARDRAFT_28801 [[Candida] arabinofermentans NRRL YB-2248]|uniref:Uncharacterized protein n=1 Tax=[Candida] arabinofermentans NRRL YB-2248 TaxID=983967 RepID=A0A1E4SZZ5_9ASCO|nr:hypothetical protein CANARDRAFT_28801 [[Candida] arabinofermentans NRRL YB-2248]